MRIGGQYNSVQGNVMKNECQSPISLFLKKLTVLKKREEEGGELPTKVYIFDC